MWETRSSGYFLLWLFYLQKLLFGRETFGPHATLFPWSVQNVRNLSILVFLHRPALCVVWFPPPLAFSLPHLRKRCLNAWPLAYFDWKMAILRYLPVDFFPVLHASSFAFDLLRA